jgi:hypothetical protein
VVSRAVFIQKSKDPTVILSILLEVVKNNFINSFFTYQIRWRWALLFISQVTWNDVTEL